MTVVGSDPSQNRRLRLLCLATDTVTTHDLGCEIWNFIYIKTENQNIGKAQEERNDKCVVGARSDERLKLQARDGAEK